MKAQKEMGKPPKEKGNRNIFQEYAEAFVVAIILAIIIRAFFVQAFKIPSRSMVPTLLVGDHILVNKLVYGIRIPFTDMRWPVLVEPSKGDIVVFIYPQDRTKDFIKRVVATGGDKVEIRNKDVYIDGEKVKDDISIRRSSQVYPKDINPRDNYGPIEVPRDHLFVLGDNRDESHDSRFWGFVPVKDVKGKAFIIYYSAMNFPNIRFNRLFKLLH
jgi:signal peptidase I